MGMVLKPRKTQTINPKAKDFPSEAQIAFKGTAKKTSSKDKTKRNVAIDKNAFLKANVMATFVGLSTKTLTRSANTGAINRFKPTSPVMMDDIREVERHLLNQNLNGMGVAK